MHKLPTTQKHRSTPPEFFLEDTCIDSILEDLFEKHGYDFRRYCRAHVRRRLHRRMTLAGIHDLETFKTHLKTDQLLFSSLVNDFSICVTEMFRDPGFFASLRKDVISYLATQPFIKIWVAGCATGEEAYSIAVLLQEEGLYERSLIYATDINSEALKSAQEGVFDAKDIRIYTENYQKSGGKRPFVDYYTAFSGYARMQDDLKKNILFTHHNLVSDGSFGEMHLVLCRNVLIYFDRDLHNRVFELFLDSLAHRGFLGIGLSESIKFFDAAKHFEEWVPEQRIYRKIS